MSSPRAKGLISDIPGVSSNNDVSIDEFFGGIVRRSPLETFWASAFNWNMNIFYVVIYIIFSYLIQY